MQANVLVTYDLRCCLADFGLAGVEESQLFTSTSRGSQGTLRWMAPEYFLDNAPQTTQPPRDIYAFGCTVLEVRTLPANLIFNNAWLDIHRETPLSLPSTGRCGS